MTNDERDRAIARIDEAVKRIEHTLNGNGHIGIVSKVHVMWRVGIAVLIALGGAVTTLLARYVTI